MESCEYDSPNQVRIVLLGEVMALRQTYKSRSAPASTRQDLSQFASGQAMQLTL